MAKKILLWAGVILLSMRIFSFSAATASESSSVSEKITKVVVDVVKQTKSNASKDPSWEKELFEICHKIVRKTAHFSLYAVLAVLTLLLVKSYGAVWLLSGIISAAYCLLFAISDEVHQLFVDGRSGQVSDVFLDFCGALAGIGICVAIAKCRLRKQNRI